ncbi:MAG: 16S rRNA (cytosine(1402)-N(4))-methyltransferase RsmH [bacterium]|nr:16S rRNA (cytosine(1402)-N(4))-methyltransferase RsmH [bacterium]
MREHIPVLAAEIVHWLDVQPGKTYLDATFGFGGHTGLILDAGGRVIALDRDEEAVRVGQEQFALAISSGSLELVHNRFDCLETVVGKRHIAGVLFDLGMSTMQLSSDRGFSFGDESLDMRMDASLGVTAADLVNGLGRRELVKLLETLGEEPFAAKIAEAIVVRRKEKPLTHAHELARLIENTVGRRGRIHPATRVFQALRMAVNDERGQLTRALPQAVSVLGSGGRLAVISFHSLEDRIVKHFGKEQHIQGALMELTTTPIRPSEEEVQTNPSSRSAKMRVFARTLGI